MILDYLIFGISITFLSFIAGMIMTALIRKTDFYNTKLSNLNFIDNERLNNLLGMGYFKWIVKNTPFKFLNQNLKLGRKISLSDVKVIRAEMTKSEIDHIFGFVFVLIFVFAKLYNQEYVFALIIFVVNVLMNLYPSLLQQQNKRRIDKLIVKFESSSRTII